MEDQEFHVVVSPGEIRCARPDGRAEVVRKSDLQAVVIEANDFGPGHSDLFWVLVDRKHGCVVPEGAYGENVLVDYLKTLPGFDYRAVIRAHSSHGNGHFLCWQRPRNAA
ncbi:MAG: hypothetical protein GC191_00185 [Azospirillum sp.]|nr:hypothetical protein [Azospirillum sp.]